MPDLTPNMGESSTGPSRLSHGPSLSPVAGTSALAIAAIAEPNGASDESTSAALAQAQSQDSNQRVRYLRACDRCR